MLKRWRHTEPCPVCGGWQSLPQGRGIRCYGFLSDDGRYAHCTREELAGALDPHPASGTYPHRLDGPCHCGRSHDRPAPPASIVPSDAQRMPGPRFPGHEPEQLGTIEHTYVYRDARGEPVHRTVRYRDPKSFRQQRRDGATWRWGLGDIRPVLYRLPELLAASVTSPVFLPEGEKDCDRLAELGLVVTTNAMGARSWLPHYACWLRGCRIVILEDNDVDGRARSGKLRHELGPIAMSVKVVRFTGLPAGSDICDWLDAGGELERLLSGLRERLEVGA